MLEEEEEEETLLISSNNDNKIVSNHFSYIHILFGIGKEKINIYFFKNKN